MTSEVAGYRIRTICFTWCEIGRSRDIDVDARLAPARGLVAMARHPSVFGEAQGAVSTAILRSERGSAPGAMKNRKRNSSCSRGGGTHPCAESIRAFRSCSTFRSSDRAATGAAPRRCVTSRRWVIPPSRFGLSPRGAQAIHRAQPTPVSVVRPGSGGPAPSVQTFFSAVGGEAADCCPDGGRRACSRSLGVTSIESSLAEAFLKLRMHLPTASPSCGILFAPKTSSNTTRMTSTSGNPSPMPCDCSAKPAVLPA